jgi:hypothetical protein
MLAETQESKVKEFIPPVYPTPKLPSYQILYKKYLKTRDFYDIPDEVEYNSILYKDAHELERKVFYKRDGRLIIYPKDIAAIYGHHESTARKLLQTIRDSKGLPKGAPITIKDFCTYTHLDYETIHTFIMES